MSSSFDQRLRTGSGGSGSIDSIVRRAAEGDRGALAELYDRLGAAVYTLARRRRTTDSAAEAMVFDVFTSLWRSAPIFPRQELPAETWVLQRIAQSIGTVPPMPVQTSGDGPARPDGRRPRGR